MRNERNDREELAERIISKHTVRFTQPPQRIPNRSSVDAPLLGNGFTAVALSGAPEAQTFYVARNDFWRLKSALDESYPLVLGKIELSMPSLQGASYLIEQQLYNATSTARFTKEDMAVTYKAYVSAVEDLLVVELNIQRKQLWLCGWNSLRNNRLLVVSCWSRVNLYVWFVLFLVTSKVMIVLLM